MSPRDKFPAGVIAVRVVGLEHSQTVLDCQTWSNHQKSLGEPPAVGMSDGVDGLPRDDHGHYGRLACSGRQLQGDAQQFRVGLLVDVGQPVQGPPVRRAQPGCNLGKPDESFHSLNLAEEGAIVAEVVLPPVQEQPGGLRCNPPVVGAGNGPPLVNMPANLVHGGSDVVLLLLGGQAQSFVDDKLLLSAPGPPPLSGFGDGSHEFGPPAAFDDPLSRLALFIQLPVLGGICVGRVDNRMVKERVFHRSASYRVVSGPPFGRPVFLKRQACLAVVFLPGRI